MKLDDTEAPIEQRNIHRKCWEYAIIAQSLYERGMLSSGRRGLGFAVGQEPLVSLFAGYGTTVLATDIGDPEIAKSWTTTGQYAGNLSALYKTNLVSEQKFKELVRYQHADMNDLSGFAKGSFDFVWSACALEHLGTLRAGIDFIFSSVDLLKPGGYAVHTTEFNVSSNDLTMENAQQCLYRRKDIKSLRDDLHDLGYTVAALDFDPGSDALDFEPDFPPYYENGRKHIKLKIGDWVCTSILLIIGRPE